MEGHPSGLHLYLSISRLKNRFVLFGGRYRSTVDDHLGDTAQVYHRLMWAERRCEKLNLGVQSVRIDRILG